MSVTPSVWIGSTFTLTRCATAVGTLCAVAGAHEAVRAARLWAAGAGFATAFIVRNARAAALVLACRSDASHGRVASRHGGCVGEGGRGGGGGRKGGNAWTEPRAMRCIQPPPACALTLGAVAEQDVAVAGQLADLVGLVGRRAGLVLAAARNGLVARARAGAGRQQGSAVTVVTRAATIRGVDFFAARADVDAHVVAHELAYGSGHGGRIEARIADDRFAVCLMPMMAC
jgi:hypothetical protein